LRKQQELWRASLSPTEGSSEGLQRQRTIRELGGILDSKPSLRKLARRIERGRVPVSMSTAGRLARLGFTVADIERFSSPAEADAAADEWEARAACGMSTRKQYKLLLSHGWAEEAIMGMTKSEAHRHV